MCQHAEASIKLISVSVLIQTKVLVMATLVHDGRASPGCPESLKGPQRSSVSAGRAKAFRLEDSKPSLREFGPPHCSLTVIASPAWTFLHPSDSGIYASIPFWKD